MSERYEMAEARGLELSVVGPGDEVGDDVVRDGDVALIIGDPYATAYVIVGTREEVATALRRALVEVQCAEVLPVGRADGRARKATNYLEQAEALPVWPAIGNGGNR